MCIVCFSDEKTEIRGNNKKYVAIRWEPSVFNMARSAPSQVIYYVFSSFAVTKKLADQLSISDYYRDVYCASLFSVSTIAGLSAN